MTCFGVLFVLWVLCTRNTQPGQLFLSYNTEVQLNFETYSIGTQVAANSEGKKGFDFPVSQTRAAIIFVRYVVPSNAVVRIHCVRRRRISHNTFHKWLPRGYIYLQSDILQCGDVESQPGPNSSVSDSRRSLSCVTGNQNASEPSNRLHCFYQNVRSIQSGTKLREFQDSVYSNQFDIVAVSETWLSQTISDSELLPWDYDIHRCDRSSSGGDSVHGGGVLIASRTNLRCRPVFLHATEESNMEYVAIELNTNNCGKVLVAVFYRPPSSNVDWIRYFIKTLENCQYNKIVILGDFNLPSITWIDGSGFCNSSESSVFTLCQALVDNNLFQLIDSPTREENYLDLLITSIVEGVSNINVSNCEGVAVSSDHKAVTFDLHFACRYHNIINRLSFNLNKADFVGLRFAFANDPLENLLSASSDDIKGDWETWKSAFLHKLEEFIPKRKPRNFIVPPWIDGEALHAIRKKNTLRKKALNKDSSTLWEKFRQLRKEVKYLIRSKHLSYLKDIADNCYSQPKRFWNYFNKLSKQSSIPNIVTLGDSSFSSADAKAEAFNKYFMSVFNDENDAPLDDDISPCLFTDKFISSIELSNEDVLAALNKLDPSKTPGPDQIHPRILKECANELAPSLCVLFNRSLSTGKLPLDWKSANITPVYKKGGKSSVTNYRQISLLSIVSKLCERCVLNKLIPELSGLLSTLQHGFIGGRSCVTQLLTVLHDLGASLDTGMESDVIYLDFSKAFDSVPHARLLHKLSWFGIQGPLHAWFADYLTLRSQRVLVDGAFSSWVPVTSGVPQGSLLAPFLFLLYVNDIPDVVSRGTSIALFADDVKSMRPVNSTNECDILQRDINSLHDWSLNWGLSFNIKKCVAMRISRKRKSPIPSLATRPYTLGGQALAEVSSQKDLGVNVTDKLTWSLHIKVTVAKANKMLGFMRRHCVVNIGVDRKRLLYLTLVRSHLGYASEVWAPQTSISDIKLLEGVQRRATRFILQCNPDSRLRPDYKSRLLSLNLLPISYWLECRDILFLYKCTIVDSYNLPINDLVSFSSGRTRSSVNNLNLRYIHRFSSSLFRDSYFNRIVTLWNNVPLAIRQQSTFSLFKTKLYEHYFHKLNTMFDVERIATWKTVCPHCRGIDRPNCC